MREAVVLPVPGAKDGVFGVGDPDGGAVATWVWLGVFVGPAVGATPLIGGGIVTGGAPRTGAGPVVGGGPVTGGGLVTRGGGGAVATFGPVPPRLG